MTRSGREDRSCATTRGTVHSATRTRIWTPAGTRRILRRRGRPAYRLAFADADFLLRDELRPVRLQLELLKPELELDARGITSTVVLFGGARVPRPGEEGQNDKLSGLSHYYEEARKFARAITERSVETNCTENVIVTGGGAGRDGGRKPRRVGGGRLFNRGSTSCWPHEQGAERVRDAGAVFQLPLFRHPQDAFSFACQRHRGLSRRFRHARRAVRCR